SSFVFFFQAEDGIRDWSVTGVQTCALPISLRHRIEVIGAGFHPLSGNADFDPQEIISKVPELKSTPPGPEWLRIAMERVFVETRSEERRVGKECRSRRGRDQ